MIIAVDFDGTLHTGKWPGIGTMAPYAADVMRKLKADGHYIIIWTCRERERQTEMVNWLMEKKIPFDRINDHMAGSWEQYGYKSKKVYAHLYIDDKQVGGLPTWPEIYNEICRMEVDYKNRQNRNECPND